MHHQVFFTWCLCFFLLSISYAQGNESFTQCFESFDCGIIKNLVFPFWNEDRPQLCRQDGFELTGCGVDDQPPIINIVGTEFRFLFFNHTNFTMTIARNDLWNNVCPSNRVDNLTLSGNPFLKFSPTNINLTFFYDCSSSLQVQPSAEFQCPSRSFYADDLVDRDSLESFREACGGGGGIQVQVNRSGYERLQSERKRADFGPRSNWDLGFDVAFDFPSIICEKCNGQNGLCDDLDQAQFPSRYPVCAKPAIRPGNLERKLIIGFIAAAGGLLISCISLCYSRKISCIRTTSLLLKFTNKDQDIEAFLRNNGSLAPKRYSYADIKKMTDSFKQKLGKGGYGSVYKGKLRDNHLVAVKVLNASKGNGQEFINEVASISRTSHVNIVTLLGFCLEDGKRALIYEFMPNGSLEKYIFEQNDPEDRRPHLTVPDLYRISIGIARGLEYLHLGCNTRILHFDIKPHNILLDDEFRPKISDFGLAKLCGGTDSIVSMFDARGTMGYVAPEVFCRNIGSVSHKSDVYSYGMMILEMAGGRKNLDVGVHRTSEIYFPHWIYRHIEQDDIEPELLGLMSKEEAEIARKMVVVGLWCIQTNPKDRPSISEVKEMLESKEALQIPPKP